MHRALFLLTLAACAGSIGALFESTRAEVLADPGPTPAQWQPDASLHLGSGLIQSLVEGAFQADSPLRGERIPLGKLGAVTPDLSVTNLRLQSVDRCEGCLAVHAKVQGRLGWELLGMPGSMPADGDLDMDFSVISSEKAGKWTVSVAPKTVRSVRLNLGGTALAAGEGQVVDWIKSQIMSHLQPYALGPFGGEDLPLRGLRVEPAQDGVRIAMLTTARGSTPLGQKSARTDGFSMDISQSALLSVARRAAFAGPPLSYDVVADPTSLTFQADHFEMGLRLWRPVGAGWWRDYTVRGDLGVTKGRLKLSPKEVVEGPKSKGAGLADPLALLGEGLILKTVEESFSTSFAANKSTKMRDWQLEVKVQNVRGARDALTVDGTLVLEPSRGQSRPRSSNAMTRPR